MEGSVFEVGLRDGLQSEAKSFSVSEKLELLKKLVDAGVKRIELGSFVRPDRIPQLANTPELIRAASLEFSRVRDELEFWAFVPNRKGFEFSAQEDLDGVSAFYSCSETFSVKNVNKKRKEAFSELKALAKEVSSASLKLRVYLSTIVHCPYEGPIAEDVVIEHAEQLLDLGVKEIALSDTTGHAFPPQISSLCAKLMKKAKAENWALHLHDTRGLALANAWEGLKLGITKFDSSIAGLGGCPYAPGASGNLASEDLANLFKGVCTHSDIDMKKLGSAGMFVEKILNRKLSSKVLRSLGAEK